MECAEVREELGPYTIGALERAAQEAVEDHLRDCSDCQAEAVAYGEVSDALSLALPLKPAPEALRDRVMAAAGIPRPPAALPRPFRWRQALVAAAAGVAIVGTLAWAIVLQLQLNDVRDENRDLVALLDGDASSRLSAHENIIYLLFEEDMAHVELEAVDSAKAAEALYVWSPADRIGVLLCNDLPHPPAGMAYQLWFESDGSFSDGGMLMPDAEGSARLIVQGGKNEIRSPWQSLIVTLETADGSPEPTGQVVLRGAAP